jgi:hypothetical protein
MSTVVDAGGGEPGAAAAGEMSTVVDAVTTHRQLAAAGKISTVIYTGGGVPGAGRRRVNVYCSRRR